MDLVRLWDRARTLLGYRWPHTHEERRAFKWDVFLSHAGEDHKEAARIAQWLKDEFHKRGRDLNIFNTSDVQDRFFPGSLRMTHRGPGGEQLESPYLRYMPNLTYSSGDSEQDLKEYLADAMKASRVYLLLITPQSVAKNSAWVEFEIRSAYKMNRERAPERSNVFFFPCASAGGRPVDFSKLPMEAQQFAEADVSSQAGLVRLAAVLRKIFKSPPTNRRAQQPYEILQ